ncbi:hypothetical protein TNCT_126501 [Trichonephila clavata]|uniref:Uncharacterized protein n=1 Tax=Trichonephila clavata TaxID=2740835 RepID=A0A8X6LRK3_TRICU|nr:hypothetical protein TNCT_126501 [Trichonephila clavata]
MIFETRLLAPISEYELFYRSPHTDISTELTGFASATPVPTLPVISASVIYSPFKGSLIIRAETYSPPLSSCLRLGMASGLNHSDMEQTPIKSPTSPIQRSTCDQQAYAKSQLELLKGIRMYKLAIVENLKKYPDHEEDHLYQNAVVKLQDIEKSLKIAVRDFDSFSSCITSGAPFHDFPLTTSPFITPKICQLFSPLTLTPNVKILTKFNFPGRPS